MNNGNAPSVDSKIPEMLKTNANLTVEIQLDLFKEI